jgi:hypothetical protein
VRPERIVHKLTQRREAMQKAVFERNISNEELKRLQGIWEGLGEAIAMIGEDLKENDDG